MGLFFIRPDVRKDTLEVVGDACGPRPQEFGLDKITDALTDRIVGLIVSKHEYKWEGTCEKYWQLNGS